jgi:hypothetical protein
MAPGELNENSRILGGLQTAVETLTRTWAEQDRRAAESRQRLYENFDGLKSDIRDRMGAVEQSVATLAADVAAMKPAVQDWKETKLKSIGATFATKLMGRSIYFIIMVALVGIGWVLAHVTVLAH